jgi:hypothetical protein
MNSTSTDFSMPKGEKDVGLWKRRVDESRNKSKAKKDHLLQL